MTGRTKDRTGGQTKDRMKGRAGSRRAVLAKALTVTAALAPILVADPAGLREAAAQAPSAQLAAQRAFDIPAQPLASALVAFGQQAGLQITVDGALARGIGAPAVRGTMASDEALKRLLAGSDLTYTTAGSTIVIQPAPRATEGAIQLETVRVEAGAIGAATEGTGSYTSGMVTIGKGEQALKDIPRSVSVVTRQRMDDLNVTDLSEALKSTTGMTVVKFDGAGLRNQFQSRGYVIDSVQLDGVSTTWDINAGTSFDTALYDRIEVLRGPAGLYQSGGEPGGAINLARKRALDRWSFGGAAGIGSWSAYRGVVDATGPLVESGRIRGRVVGVLDDRESFMDVVESNKKTLYGTLEADLTPATTVSVGATVQKFDAVQDFGLPAYADGRLLDVPRSTFAGAKWNNMDYDAAEQFAELEHRLDNGGRIKLSVRHLGQDSDTVGLWANSFVDPVTGDYDAIVWASKRETDEWTADGHVSTPVEIGGLTHNVLLGFDYRTRRTEWISSPFITVPQTFNIHSVDHNPVKPALRWNDPRRTRTEQYGAYGQLRIKPGLDWLTLVGGARVSWWNTTTRNLRTKVDSGENSVSREFTPYAGVVVDASENIALYASYAEIFTPQSNQAPGGRTLAPRVGEAWEAGVKGSFLGNRLNAHLAVYHMLDKNRAVEIDGCIGTECYTEAGKVRSRGVEAEITGSPWPNWEMWAGYAYVQTNYVGGDPATRGDRFSTSTPKHTAALGLKYTFPEGTLLEGLSLGGAVRRVSSFYGVDSGTRWIQDGYTVADAMIGYAVSERLNVSLTVNNLFDEKYYEKVDGWYRQNYYGAPRSAMLTLRATW